MNRKNIKVTKPCSFEEICRNEWDKRRFLPFDKLSFGVWIWYGPGNRLFFSESFFRLVGIPKGMVPNLELLAECIYPDDLERFFGFLEGLVDGVMPGDFTFRVWLGDGEIRWIRCVVGRMGREVVGVCWQLSN
jgi:hypothetical protein